MVLFGSTMKQWQLALSLSVGPGARVFVAECDPLLRHRVCVSVCASTSLLRVVSTRSVSLQFESDPSCIGRFDQQCSSRSGTIVTLDTSCLDVLSKLSCSGCDSKVFVDLKSSPSLSWRHHADQAEQFRSVLLSVCGSCMDSKVSDVVTTDSPRQSSWPGTSWWRLQW